MCARQWALPTLDHGARSSPTPPHSGSQGPSAWVMRWCERLAPGSEVLDLACGSWPFQAQRYDAVVVANYLYRPMLPLLAQALRDGGILVYETFAAGNERFGRPSNPAFLLAPFELAACFAPLLHVLAFEDGVVQRPAPARVQRLCAVRTESTRLERLLLPESR